MLFTATTIASIVSQQKEIEDIRIGKEEIK